MLKENLQQLSEKLDEVADLCYKQQEKEAYIAITALIDALVRITAELDAYRCEHEEFEYSSKGIMPVLTSLLEALNNRDIVLVADIIECDLKEYLNDATLAL